MEKWKVFDFEQNEVFDSSSIRWLGKNEISDFQSYLNSPSGINKWTGYYHLETKYIRGLMQNVIYSTRLEIDKFWKEAKKRK